MQNTILAVLMLISICVEVPAFAQEKSGHGQHKHTNELAKESSPYLLMHAHNPVNWYAWNDAVDRLLELPLVPRDGARVVS